MQPTTHRTPDRDEELALKGFLTVISGHAWGVSLGLLLGLLLFAATNVLVLRGGPDVGQHLGLLSQFLPGYQVNFVGSLIGFAYAFVIGYLTGRLICGVYNRASRK